MINEEKILEFWERKIFFIKLLRTGKPPLF